jgi:hypothetical protein
MVCARRLSSERYSAVVVLLIIRHSDGFLKSINYVIDLCAANAGFDISHDQVYYLGETKKYLVKALTKGRGLGRADGSSQNPTNSISAERLAGCTTNILGRLTKLFCTGDS